MRYGRVLVLVAVCALAAVVLGQSTERPAATALNSITSPDTGLPALLYSSLALDASGNPVVSYSDFSVSPYTLNVMRCNDPNCAGADESIASPYTGTAYFTSLGLDALGKPVVSFHNTATVEVLHCGNVDCTSGNTLQFPTSGSAAGQMSLALNSSGLPFISWAAGFFPSGPLHVTRCGDAACTPQAATTHEPWLTGAYPSLALDGSGYPVVSFQDGNYDLRVIRCANEYCTFLTSSVAVDSVGTVGRATSLVLDASGNPVVSYFDDSNDMLKVVHCGDAACSTGNIIAPVAAIGGGVLYDDGTSLELDAAGNPVVSYYYDHSGSEDLRVLHCGNPTCTAGNTIATPDSAGSVGSFSSLELDAAGNPVVSYYDATSDALRILHCGNPNCTPPAEPDADGDGCTNAAEQQIALGSEETGGRRNAKSPWDFFDVWTHPMGNPSGWERNQQVDLFGDIFGVAMRYGAQRPGGPPSESEALVEALVPPVDDTSYHAAYDRSPAAIAEDPWDMGPPNGTIDLFTDIFGAAYQFGHDCS